MGRTRVRCLIRQLGHARHCHIHIPTTNRKRIDPHPSQLKRDMTISLTFSPNHQLKLDRTISLYFVSKPNATQLSGSPGQRLNTEFVQTVILQQHLSCIVTYVAVARIQHVRIRLVRLLVCTLISVYVGQNMSSLCIFLHINKLTKKSNSRSLETAAANFVSDGPELPRCL